MIRRLHRSAGLAVTMGLLLMIAGGARPARSASVSAEPSSPWTTRVSVASDGTGGSRRSSAPSISAGGRYVAFASEAPNLVVGDTNDFCDTDFDGFYDDNCSDVFVHDRATGETERVSVAQDGTQSNNWSMDPDISGDGRYVAFLSVATNLVGDGEAGGILVHDRETGQISRVSVATGGAQVVGTSTSPSISADGRYVAFTSTSRWLVEGDTNDEWDVFVHDRQTVETVRVSVASDGAEAIGGPSLSPSISALGDRVAFGSYATNLVAGDDNNFCDTDFDGQFDDNCPDVFVRDLVAQETTRVSVASDGTQANRESRFPSISAGGRYVAFSSPATNLVPDDAIANTEVFVHDTEGPETTRVSVALDGTQGDSLSSFPSISAGGRYVAFSSQATNLVAGDDNGESDVFVRDREAGATRRISVASDGTQSNDESLAPSISGDGRYVAFDSDADNLVVGDTNNARDVFLHGSSFRVHLPFLFENYWQLSIVLGQDNVEQGLYLHDCPDADTFSVLAGSPLLEGRQTGNGDAVYLPGGNDEPDLYMQFDAYDGTIYQTPPGTRPAVVVTYLDEGTDTFSVQYDAHSGGPYGDGRFRDTGSVTKTGSGEWRVHTFILDDAYFANRDNGADFRIDDHGDGAEVIHRVTVHP